MNALGVEQTMAFQVKHANSGSAADRAKAKSLLGQLNKLRFQAVDELFPIWERTLAPPTVRALRDRTQAQGPPRD